MGKYDVDLIGKRFGKLIALEKISQKGKAIWKCQCDCGNIVNVYRCNLTQGHTKSCGCLKYEPPKTKWKLEDFQKKYESDPHNISVIALTEDEKRVIMHCNNCGKEFDIERYTAMGQFRNCPFCGDGISFPNKFLRNFILQLPVQDYKFEFCPDWSLNKVYDAYFSYNGNNYVVEIDGIQHFNNKLYRTKEEEQTNDLLKDNLAKNANHIMIRINAEKSSVEYLVEQIKQSLFNDLFDLSKINWIDCGNKSVKSVLIEVCNSFNKEPCSLADLAKKFNLGHTTVHRYIQQGKQLNLVREDADEILKQIRIDKIRQAKSKI